MTSGWSKGGIMASPSAAQISSALSLRSTDRGPTNTTSPPSFFTPSTLICGRGVRHDDDRPDADLGGGPGHGLSVVAAGVGDDAALPDGGGDPLDGVVGAAHLERPDRLELFALEGHRVPHERGERRHLDERRPDGDALDGGRRAADVVNGDGGAERRPERCRWRRVRGSWSQAMTPQGDGQGIRLTPRRPFRPRAPRPRRRWAPPCRCRLPSPRARRPPGCRRRRGS